MQIDKNWRIKSDNLNVILERRQRVPERKGKPEHDRWVVQGYYSSVKEALHAMVDQRVKDTGLTDLKAIVKAIEEVHSLIDSMAKAGE
jgi:hypothetical protein